MNHISMFIIWVLFITVHHVSLSSGVIYTSSRRIFFKTSSPPNPCTRYVDLSFTFDDQSTTIDVSGIFGGFDLNQWFAIGFPPLVGYGHANRDFMVSYAIVIQGSSTRTMYEYNIGANTCGSAGQCYDGGPQLTQNLMYTSMNDTHFQFTRALDTQDANDFIFAANHIKGCAPHLVTVAIGNNGDLSLASTLSASHVFGKAFMYFHRDDQVFSSSLTTFTSFNTVNSSLSPQGTQTVLVEMDRTTETVRIVHKIYDNGTVNAGVKARFFAVGFPDWLPLNDYNIKSPDGHDIDFVNMYIDNEWVETHPILKTPSCAATNATYFSSYSLPDTSICSGDINCTFATQLSSTINVNSLTYDTNAWVIDYDFDFKQCGYEFNPDDYEACGRPFTMVVAGGGSDDECASSWYLGNGQAHNTDIQQLNLRLPTAAPTVYPTNHPTFDPTHDPTVDPTTQPTSQPTVHPTANPTINPTFDPTQYPTRYPTVHPTVHPTIDPTVHPTIHPTVHPTADPTIDPTFDPTTDPTRDPTTEPTTEPTVDPTSDPTIEPTSDPTIDPTIDPTTDPTIDPTTNPTIDPTIDPTTDPTIDPTKYPTFDPTKDPTMIPTTDPTNEPTMDPTKDPTIDPTFDPTKDPTMIPTVDPTIDPTSDPTIDPTSYPTMDPTFVLLPCDATSWHIEFQFTFIAHTNMDFIDEMRDLIVWVLKKVTANITAGVDRWDDDEWCAELLPEKFIVETYDARRRRRLLANTTSYKATAVLDINEDLKDDIFVDGFNWVSFSNTYSAAVSIRLQSIGVQSLQIIDVDINERSAESHVFDYALITLIALLSFGILLMVAGKLTANKQGADDLHIFAIVYFLIYIWDQYSDILFAVSLYDEYALSSPFYMALFVATLVFIVVPFAKNVHDLWILQEKWKTTQILTDRYTEWINENGTKLFFLSFICGSTYAPLMLVNSNLFGLRLFSLGLSHKELKEINKKRVVNVVLSENFPQLVIQIIFLGSVRGLSGVSLLAIISSSVSICVAVLSSIQQRRMDQGGKASTSLFSFRISYDASNENVDKELKAYEHKTKSLSEGIAEMLKLDHQTIECLPIQRFSDETYGGSLEVFFYVRTANKTFDELNQQLQESTNSFLAKQIVNVWQMGSGTKLVITGYNSFPSKSDTTKSMSKIEIALTNETQSNIVDGEKSTLS